MLKNIYLIFCLLIVGTVAISCEKESLSSNNANVEFENAFVVAPPKGRTFTLGGFTVTSKMDQLYLVSISTDRAKSVEMHDVTVTNGIMKMRKVNRMAFTSDEPLYLEKGGKHLMLFDIDPNLKIGDKITLEVMVEDSLGDTNVYEIEAEFRSTEDN